MTRLDGVVQRLEMLDVDGGHHTDAGVEQLQDVLIALLVPAARRVGVCELVDDAERRLSRENGVEVHLLEHDAAIVDLSPGNDFEIADPSSVSARPCVSTKPMTTSTPSRRNVCASSIIV